MTTTFQIEGYPLTVDCAKTKAFYLTQPKIIDDCQCGDCRFYAERVTEEPLEIFALLSSMGVDVRKNLDSEPTGVWCIRDDDGSLLHSDQLYRIVGQFPAADRTQLEYSEEQGGYEVRAVFLTAGNDTIDIVLTIDKA